MKARWVWAQRKSQENEKNERKQMTLGSRRQFRVFRGIDVSESRECWDRCFVLSPNFVAKKEAATNIWHNKKDSERCAAWQQRWSKRRKKNQQQREQPHANCLLSDVNVTTLAYCTIFFILESRKLFTFRWKKYNGRTVSAHSTLTKANAVAEFSLPP